MFVKQTIISEHVWKADLSCNYLYEAEMFGDIFAELADILGNHVGKEDMLGNMFLKMTCFGTHSINSLPNNNKLKA